jgi:hypothetical protein
MSLTNTALQKPITSTRLGRKYIVGQADIAAGGAFTTVDILLDTLPAGAIIEYDKIKHTVAVAGAAGPISAATARLKLVTRATSPITTQLGAGALNVFLAPGVLDGTSSITGVTAVAGDAEALNDLYMTVTETGATTGLSDVTAGEVHAWINYAVI